MEILAITLLVPIGGITIIALLAAQGILLPDAVQKTHTNLERSLGRSLLLGTVNFIFFVILGLFFFWLSEKSGGFLTGILIFIAGIILIGVVILASLGLSAFAKLFGERISAGKTPFMSHLRGGTLLILAALAPYVGWFIFLPLVLWTGFGAAISALLLRKEKKVPAIQE